MRRARPYAGGVSEDNKDEGGIVLGGISFGITEQPAASQQAVAGAAAPRHDDIRSQPVALDDELLPLRVAVVADLNARGEYNAGAHPPEHPIRIDPLHLSELFRQLAPRASLEVDSVLLEGGKARITFSPRDMTSFRPDKLCQDIPLLRSLLDGKRVLERLRDGTADVDAAARELAQLWDNSPFVATVLGGVQRRGPAPAPVAAPAPPSASDDVSALLDMVDMGPGAGPTSADTGGATAAAPVAATTTRASGKGRFDAFLQAIAHSGGHPRGARPAEGIRSIEQALALQLGAIVQHPEFRRLEQAWRGLAFLCSRAPKTGVRIEVLSASAQHAPEALERIINAHTSVEPPVSLAVVDVAVGADAASLALWRRLGEVGEGYTVPIITNASANLLGRTQLDDIDRLDNKQALFDAAQSLPWRTQAQRTESMWV
ncbi:MAG TPA: hypothetical protein ENK23_09185, partial [Sorangium sp.]|nr:hypothetical protein [Sorangium sp.]